jgi:hypothetical protein
MIAKEQHLPSQERRGIDTSIMRHRIIQIANKSQLQKNMGFHRL